MAERDTRFGGNLETANIRPREYQPSDRGSDRGIANVSNVDDRSLFQRGADVGRNIYERVDSFIPEYRDDMLNWNVNTDYGRFGLGVGQGKGMLNWSLPLSTSSLNTGRGGLGEYQMAGNWNLDELDSTNKLINLYNSFHGNALEYGDQDDADQWLIQIQNLMGQLPRANRGGIIGLI